MVKHSSSYDVCIIGSGPAGLACLSAIREPYSIDHMTEAQVQRAVHSLKLHHQLSVCVIDPEPNWMNTWKTSFEHLNIQHLRSPTIAHPNLFDRNALLAFACQQGRESELYESGCSEIKALQGLGQTQVGLWKLPSTKLFLDFCDDMVSNLAHAYLQGLVVDLLQQDQDGMHCLQYTDPTERRGAFLRVTSFLPRAHWVGRFCHVVLSAVQPSPGSPPKPFRRGQCATVYTKRSSMSWSWVED
jgi:hypothetical protein